MALRAAEDPLSPREVEVLRLVAAGEAIAWRLGIAEDTVKAHVKAIFAEPGVADRTRAATLAIERGISWRGLPERRVAPAFLAEPYSR